MRKNPVTPEERQMMLFWWTVYGGNYNKTAKKVSELTGIKRSRKVVFETAKRHNFATLSHDVRDQVNKQFYGDSSPGVSRLMKMVMDLMELDEALLSHAKNYIMGGVGRTNINNMSEALNVIKHVTSDLSNITGKVDIKSDSFASILESTKPEISISVNKELDELDENERADVVGEIIDIQTARILDYKDNKKVMND